MSRTAAISAFVALITEMESLESHIRALSTENRDLTTERREAHNRITSLLNNERADTAQFKKKIAFLEEGVRAVAVSFEDYSRYVRTNKDGKPTKNKTKLECAKLLDDLATKVSHMLDIKRRQAALGVEGVPYDPKNYGL